MLVAAQGIVAPLPAAFTDRLSVPLRSIPLSLLPPV